MERIESATNATVKLAASLAMRKKREETGLFVAEGVRLAETAAEAADWRPVFAFVTPRALENGRAAKVVETLGKRGCPVCETPESVYRKAADTETPQGLLVVMEQRRPGLDELIFPGGETPLWVVLDGVQDPGNAGMILRTADAAGASGVIALAGTVDLFSPKVVRATMGTLFHLPVVSGMTADDFLAAAQSAGWRLCVTALDPAARPCFAADFTGPTAIVFGNEGSGVSPALLTAAEHVYIPMRGRAESLNVAASAAVILYEALRQRHYRNE